jgi:RimJ/RimL family protein N-acetyltransferase
MGPTLEPTIDGPGGSGSTLQTGDILLRPWTVEDATWYVESRDEEVYRWTTERRELTVEETVAAIKQVNDNPFTVSYAIVDNQSLQILGNLALVLADNRKSAEVMYWLAPWGRGRGVATNSVKLLCQWAFTQFDLVRITLQTHPDNVRSQSVALRAGFQGLSSGNEDQVSRNHVWFELRP